MMWLLVALAAWAGGWLVNAMLAKRDDRLATLLIPLVFGVSVLTIWHGLVRGLHVPAVILPSPVDIWAALVANVPTLWADFVQTVLKSVLPGYVIGCGAAFLVAIAIDRSPFLQRGLLPIGNLAAALPIVGIAPIMVMWFGFDWHSKAAVVVVMCFFPMLVNVMEGLRSSETMQRDLMHTYAASYLQTLLKLRLPAAGPFIFNGLKICTTLSLIGAIVAEFSARRSSAWAFAFPPRSAAWRSTWCGPKSPWRPLAGSAFYGAVALIERSVTFWHPSNQG